jgi:SOS-response transcriptional repressor LexA
MAAPGSAYSWNSELPSGHNPFWIRDEALSGLGLHPGDAVSVDTRAEPSDGDVVVVEVELDGDSQRTARRYFTRGDSVRLESVGDAAEPLELPSEEVIVMGVVVGRIRFSPDREQAIEEPL